jgi:glucose dehydrogenase
VTAGQLLFAGQSPGSFDAWHASTGQHLWSWPTEAGCNAPPASYMSTGRQFVVVACSGNQLLVRLGLTSYSDQIIGFTLSRTHRGRKTGPQCEEG